MVAHGIILSLALLSRVEGSRLGGPKDADAQREWLAWKDADGQHVPPGRSVSSKHSDMSKHAWAGKTKRPKWTGRMLNSERPNTDEEAPEQNKNDESESHEKVSKMLNNGMLNIDDELPEPVGAGMARRVLQRQNNDERDEDFESSQKVMAGYDSDNEIERALSDSSTGEPASRNDEETKRQWLAWKNSNGHHVPPGHSATHKHSDTSKHAWVGKGKHPQWNGGMLNSGRPGALEEAPVAEDDDEIESRQKHAKWSGGMLNSGRPKPLEQAPVAEVDDDVESRREVGRMLNKMGYEVPEPVGAGMARKVLQPKDAHDHDDEFESRQKVMAGYDSDSKIDLESDSSLGDSSNEHSTRELRKLLPDDLPSDDSGSLNDEDAKRQWMAWKDTERQHAPPGRSESSRHSDTSKHAWMSKGKRPNWNGGMLNREQPKTVEETPAAEDDDEFESHQKHPKWKGGMLNSGRPEIVEEAPEQSEPEEEGMAEDDDEIQAHQKVRRMLNNEVPKMDDAIPEPVGAGMARRALQRKDDYENDQKFESRHKVMARYDAGADLEADSSIDESRSREDENTESKRRWQAWKNSDTYHVPPGHSPSPTYKHSDTSEHAWERSRKPQWDGMLNGRRHEARPETVEEAPEPVGAGMARRVLNHRREENDEFKADSDVIAKYDSDSDIGLESDSSEEISYDLQETLEEDAVKSVTLTDFMPKCLKHTKSLIADLDYNYGDAQLETILRNWCYSAKEFPNARGSRKVIGFRNHVACTDFADDLKNARYYELSHQSDKGYKEFCSAFYGHHDGFGAPSPPPPAPPPKPPVFNSASFAGVSTMVAMTSLLLYLA